MRPRAPKVQTTRKVASAFPLDSSPPLRMHYTAHSSASRGHSELGFSFSSRPTHSHRVAPCSVRSAVLRGACALPGRFAGPWLTSSMILLGMASWPSVHRSSQRASWWVLARLRGCCALGWPVWRRPRSQQCLESGTGPPRLIGIGMAMRLPSRIKEEWLALRLCKAIHQRDLASMPPPPPPSAEGSAGSTRRSVGSQAPTTYKRKIAQPRFHVLPDTAWG